MANSICLKMESQCTSQERELAAKDNINELIHSQDMLFVKTLVGACRGLRQLRQRPDHLSRCIGEHSQIIPSGRRRETRRECGLKSWFCQMRFSRCQRASRVVVSAGSPSATLTVRRGAPRVRTRADASPCCFEGMIIRRHGRPKHSGPTKSLSDELSHSEQ